jgi:hypothetical protein
MSLEVESQDVIRLVLQFLKEHNLNDAMKALQRESGVALNTVDSVETFASDIRNGKWDSVLAQTAALKLPGDKLVSRVQIMQITHTEIVCCLVFLCKNMSTHMVCSGANIMNSLSSISNLQSPTSKRRLYTSRWFWSCSRPESATSQEASYAAPTPSSL